MTKADDDYQLAIAGLQRRLVAGQLTQEQYEEARARLGQPPSQSAREMNKGNVTTLLGITLGVVLFFGAVFWWASAWNAKVSQPAAVAPPAAVTPRFVVAANSCNVMSGTVRDAGASMTFDTQGKKDSSGDTIELVACVLRGLKAPSYVISHIDSTRALDGQQTDEWDGVKARWTYHPDNGLRITLVDTRLTK